MISIVVVLQGVAILALAGTLVRQTKDIKSLKDDVWELLNNRNHISRMEQDNIERTGRYNRSLIELLANELDKKIVPEYHENFIGRAVDYELVDLTDNEKEINKLKSEIQELEDDGD